MQEVNCPSTSIRQRQIHVHSRALGHIQIQRHNPIQNTYKYEIKYTLTRGDTQSGRRHSPKSPENPKTLESQELAQI